jgi:acetyl-CoA carboxylase, biotin carboxylase subunit
VLKKVLIANRGEIAVRIMRTCREMGIRTVAVFSDADCNGMHVSAADESYWIGGSQSRESYLRQDRILEVAHKVHADAIHPGYGFLAENPIFAERVAAEGLVWIGPPASAINAMGTKTGARDVMRRAGLPIVPGSHGHLNNADEAREFATQSEFPVLLKAIAGGGGKGMRIVNEESALEDAFEAVRREALASFSDGRIYAEKYLKDPRHIEIQILADSHGQVVHLGERECSLQRRHQKIIEESPSIAISDDLREKMGATAVAAAKACGYVNAGTIEMLLDKSGHFYFLEMNTRLQVEHPVTEEITGLDLVRMQLMIAAGEHLPFCQDEISRKGHSIEVRIYAEDTPNGFLPSTGTVRHMRIAAGPGVRADCGLQEGDEVTCFYDPMIGKLIVRAETREAARTRMIRVLRETEISGLRTNLSYCRHILESELFIQGRFHTQSADNELFDSYLRELNESIDNEPVLAAAIVTAYLSKSGNLQHKKEREINSSQWTQTGRANNLR